MKIYHLFYTAGTRPLPVQPLLYTTLTDAEIEPFLHHHRGHQLFSDEDGIVLQHVLWPHRPAPCYPVYDITADLDEAHVTS